MMFAVLHNARWSTKISMNRPCEIGLGVYHIMILFVARNAVEARRGSSGLAITSEGNMSCVSLVTKTEKHAELQSIL